MTARRDLVPSREQLELKRATKSLVRAVGGSDGAAASLSEDGRHVRQQRVSDCTLPNTPDFLRIDEAGELEDLSHGQPGWPHVTRALAKRQGFVLVREPSARFSETIWAQRAARLLKEGGDVISGLGARLETGGDVDPQEAASLLPDADELVEIAIEVREALRRRAQGEF